MSIDDDTQMPMVDYLWTCLDMKQREVQKQHDHHALLTSWDWAVSLTNHWVSYHSDYQTVV